MNYKEIFKKHLNSFSPVLAQFGFGSMRLNKIPSRLFKEQFNFEFLNHQTGVELGIGYSVWEDGNSKINMNMIKNTDKRCFFFLNRFLEIHNLKHKLTYQCPPDVDFDAFLLQYFKEIEALFRNELNDQITGKTFEDHSKFLEESWKQHKLGIPKDEPSVVYEMEKKEVADFIEKKKLKKDEEN